MPRLVVPLAIGCLLAHEADRVEWPHPRDWIAAQVQVESSWRPDARSRYASGLAQFTAAAWQDWSPRTDPSCAGEQPTDPACAVRAQLQYMGPLLRACPPAHTAWRAYNGGPGWIRRERRACANVPGCDPRQPLHLERMCRAVGRSAAACRENLAYPRRIEALL